MKYVRRSEIPSQKSFGGKRNLANVCRMRGTLQGMQLIFVSSTRIHAFLIGNLDRHLVLKVS